MYNYQLIVGNVGTVYEGPNGFEAMKQYWQYVACSKAPYGRASGEDVTLICDDEIKREFVGYNNEG